MKRIIRILGAFIILFNIAVIFPQTITNVDAYEYTIADVEGWQEKDTGVTNAAQNITGTAIVLIRTVGTGMAIIMITYVAIKYMSAAPEEKAEFKKSATAFIVGAIVLFAASNILAIIAKFATANIKT